MKKGMAASVCLAALLAFSACDSGLFRKKRTYYECNVTFYVNPEAEDVPDDESSYQLQTYSDQVMDNMVKLLSADSFTEFLMLDGETVPQLGVWTVGKDGQDVSSEVNAGINEAKSELQSVNELYLDLSVEEEVVLESYQNLRVLWNAEVVNSDADPDYWSYSEEAYAVLLKQGNLSATLQAAYADYAECKQDFEEKKAIVKLAEKSSQERIDEALALWRTTNEYQTGFEQYAEGITYSYSKQGEEGIDRNFLYAKISVLENESVAAKLLSRILSHLPAYVQENMPIIKGYVGTHCVAISKFNEIKAVKK